jgi:hypothetical protein
MSEMEVVITRKLHCNIPASLSVLQVSRVNASIRDASHIAFADLPPFVLNKTAASAYPLKRRKEAYTIRINSSMINATSGATTSSIPGTKLGYCKAKSICMTSREMVDSRGTIHTAIARVWNVSCDEHSI